LYGCETWSLTLREERRLRASENRLLIRISGYKNKEEIVGRRILHNGERHNFYSNIIKILRPMRIHLAGFVSQMREKINTCKISAEKPEENELLQRPEL
jgi:hypothetical protein